MGQWIILSVIGCGRCCYGCRCWCRCCCCVCVWRCGAVITSITAQEEQNVFTRAKLVVGDDCVGRSIYLLIHTFVRSYCHWLLNSCPAPYMDSSLVNCPMLAIVLSPATLHCFWTVWCQIHLLRSAKLTRKRGTIISTNPLNCSVWIYLDARRIKYWDGFPIGICVNRHFFGWRCTQRIQNCPNILVDLQTFRHRWFAVNWKYEPLILHFTVKVIFTMDLPAHRTSPTRSASIAIQL